MDNTSVTIASNTTSEYRSQFVEDLLKGSKLIATAIIVVNIYEDAHCIQLKLGTSGFKKGDFRIEIRNGTLFLFAEKSENVMRTGSNNYSVGIETFSKSFTLSTGIDIANISVRYTEGSLLLDLPKM